MRLKDFELHRPRQWGACWLALGLWEQLQLDAFWQKRLHQPEEKSWLNVLKTLSCYRLIDPGSEWRLHRQWWMRKRHKSSERGRQAGHQTPHTQRYISGSCSTAAPFGEDFCIQCRAISKRRHTQYHASGHSP